MMPCLTDSQWRVVEDRSVVLGLAGGRLSSELSEVYGGSKQEEMSAGVRVILAGGKRQCFISSMLPR